MNKDLLITLSNADSIASKEDEVREILYEELKDVSDDISYDHLGSIIFHKKACEEHALKLMFCAHMDEVGFLVRHISDIGFVYLINLGGVLDKSKEMQQVRITTRGGKKITGILNVTKNDKGSIKEMYVDIGCDNKEEVEAYGVEIGNMVCFASHAQQMNDSKVYAGKAMDDRAGCYVIAQAMKRLKDEQVHSDLYFCGTSSEEVGIRGGKTATYQIDPDIVFAIDVANNPELVKNYTNHRLLGKGCMIVHYDKTMAPNDKLLNYVKDIACKHDISYQCDMFSGGGTDAGNAHLTSNGKLAVVLGIPLRYCHGAWSLVHEDDLEQCISLVVELVRVLRRETYEEFINFQGGNK